MVDTIVGEELDEFTVQAPSLLRAAAKHIAAIPQAWNQDDWIGGDYDDSLSLQLMYREPDCGTTLCTAGWIALELGNVRDHIAATAAEALVAVSDAPLQKLFSAIAAYPILFQDETGQGFELDLEVEPLDAQQWADKLVELADRIETWQLFDRVEELLDAIETHHRQKRGLGYSPMAFDHTLWRKAEEIRASRTGPERD